MEDASFQKKDIDDIYDIRHKEDANIQAGTIRMLANLSLLQAQKQITLPWGKFFGWYQTVVSWPMQTAIEDIENATGTVRGWKNRQGLNYLVVAAF